MVEVVHSNTVHHYVIKDYNLFSRNFILIFLAILLLRRSLVFQTNLALSEIVFNNFWLFYLIMEDDDAEIVFCFYLGRSLSFEFTPPSFLFIIHSFTLLNGCRVWCCTTYSKFMFSSANRIFMAAQNKTKMVWILFF